MDARLERLIQLTDRVLMHVKYGMPPEQVCIDELEQIIAELKGELKDDMSEVPLSR
jgi:hypothetical protein